MAIPSLRLPWPCGPRPNELLRATPRPTPPGRGKLILVTNPGILVTKCIAIASGSEKLKVSLGQFCVPVTRFDRILKSFLLGRIAVHGRILIVDDEHDTADALAKLVRTFGYEARAVYDGEQAIEQFSTFLPDMALIDIGMPGMNGYEAVSYIRQSAGNIHVILVAVTGWTREEDKRQAYEAGFDIHVSKPMNAEVLKGLLALLDPVTNGERSSS